jgi:hypothetical protein
VSTREELLQSFERQFNFIRNQIIVGNYVDAVKSSELFATYLRVKVEELGEKESE